MTLSVDIPNKCAINLQIHVCDLTLKFVARLSSNARIGPLNIVPK